MSLAMDQGPRRHRITVEEYHRMAEVGLLAPDARTELIGGEIIDMAPIGMRHGSAVNWLAHLLKEAVSTRAIVWCQTPIVLDDVSEPEPDLALLTSSQDFYKQRRPTAADTKLIIEVSDTSLRYDRQTKMPLYALHGIPEYWVVDTAGKQVHVCRHPSGAKFAEVSSIENPGIVHVEALPGVSVDLSALLK